MAFLVCKAETHERRGGGRRGKGDKGARSDTAPRGRVVRIRGSCLNRFWIVWAREVCDARTVEGEYGS